MLGALLVYGLCGLSGFQVERRLVLNSLVKRVLLVFVSGAAQLMVSIQFLSLWKGLTGPGLILVNLAVTGTAFALLARRRSPPGRLSWRRLIDQRVTELRALSSDALTVALFSMALGLFATACVAGWIMIPYNDTYHFEMPLFWIQNHSVLPFPVHNPRIVALSFLSEALQLPGYLYTGLRCIPQVATASSGLLALWVIFSLSRRIGASFVASTCAAAISVGYTAFALDCFHASAEMFLAGAWFGASLLFLTDAYANGAKNPLRTGDLCCSVFCFLMACGAKNSTILLTPVYLPFLAMVLKAGLFQRREMLVRDNCVQISGGGESVQAKDKDAIGDFQDRVAHGAGKLGLSIVLCGIIGLLCSGVAWNYASNKLWFGKAGLPKVLSTTVSKDFHPRAIWTRICRGAVLAAYDTIWIPKGSRDRYASLCEFTVKILGGQKEMAEDNDYYSFKAKDITPLKGLGLLGMAFFFPGLVWACARCIKRTEFNPSRPLATGFNTTLLVVMAIGSFVMCHLVLRWQCIGVLRLMFPFVVAGAPLSALLLEKRGFRASALVLLAISGAMFFTFWMGHVSRRLNWAERPGFKLIGKLQNNHASAIQYQWKGQPACELQILEDYSYREIYEKLLQGIRQPSTIGFIGYSNSDCIHIFGNRFQNRVVPLIDCRTPNKILEPPSDLDYLVADDRFSEIGGWAGTHGFEEIFSATNARGSMVMAFGKVTSKSAKIFGNSTGMPEVGRVSRTAELVYGKEGTEGAVLRAAGTIFYPSLAPGDCQQALSERRTEHL